MWLVFRSWMWTHQCGQTRFHFLPHLRRKGHIEKTSLTPAIHAQGPGGGICPQQCTSLYRHRCNWSGKTHYRDQKWSEHFPSGKPLHRRTPGETHQEMLEEITSRFTYHFSLGLSDGISCKAHSREINLWNDYGAVPFFFFFFLDSLTLNHTALKSRICDHDGMLCLLADNRQKRNLRHDFDLIPKYLMTVGSGGCSGSAQCCQYGGPVNVVGQTNGSQMEFRNSRNCKPQPGQIQEIKANRW